MPDDSSPEITQILNDWNDGSNAARERLLEVVYDILKHQARILMSRERADHTLQPTALVHEAFLKMGDAAGIEWKDRSHFFGVTTRLMRQILVDHARGHAAQKRGGNSAPIPMDDIHAPVKGQSDHLLAIDEALERLSSLDTRQAKIVEMKFFGGLSNAEIASIMDISERTVIREWSSARLWLYREMGCADSGR